MHFSSAVDRYGQADPRPRQFSTYSKLVWARNSDRVNGNFLTRGEKLKEKGSLVTKLYACLGSGNCFKPWLAMHQLGHPFEVVLIDVLRGEQKSPEYLAINPLGVVPHLQTDTGQGIGESNAMLWYLAEGSYLMPATREARAEALQWMYFEQSKLEPFISPARFFTTILPDQREARAADIKTWQASADIGLSRLDAHLENREFMLDTGYSIADIATFGYVHVLEEAGLRMADYPAIAHWVNSVAQTKGFRPLAELGQAESKAA
ncbi:glutathione S-transferase family protein [uncultured Roseobacter sp.]|uniref:glutathione S-transferase family protein n=1 Tax=uncultured Roseobacter sp. TaxID=114847 RepID=UPI00261343D2|nr:glutathione S-transferase family protein [uncultured Roseobacter sp.]